MPELSGNPLKHCIPISQEKHRLSLTNQRYVTGGTTIPKADETVVLLSGECSF